MSNEQTPRPGSYLAQDAGCLCPILDNNHGRWAPLPPDDWYISENCPLHSLPAEVAEPTAEPSPGNSPADDALVVIPRPWEAIKGRKRHRFEGWTLHKASCTYAVRSKRKMPAPESPYPHTVPCVFCRPTGGEVKKITRSRPRRRPDDGGQSHQQRAAMGKGGHVNTYTEIGNGMVRATCTVCDIVAEGTGREAARLRSYRLHNKRAAAEEASA